MDSTEEYHSDRIRKHIERQEQKKKENTFVEALISTLVAQNTLQTTAFFSIQFIPLCDYKDVSNNGETVVIPLEVGLSKFTLEKGEIASMQRLIFPGELSTEENNLAQVSFRHHGIGRDDVAKAKTWAAVWADIKNFICSGAQGSRAKRPILITREKGVQLRCLEWLASRARESAHSYQLCEAEDFHRIMSVECDRVKSTKFENFWTQACQHTTACEGQGPSLGVSRENERSVHSKCPMHYKKDPTYQCALSHARALCNSFLLVAVDAAFIDNKTYDSFLFRWEQVQSTPSSPLQPQQRNPSLFFGSPSAQSNPSSPAHLRSEKGRPDDEHAARESANLEKWDIDYAADPWNEMNNNARRKGMKPPYENYYY